MVLTMVYNTQNYWVFGLCPLSAVLKTREHNISETGSISLLRLSGETPTLLGPLERANLHHWTFQKLDLFPSSGEGRDNYPIRSLRNI
jgi:hypothetical protein